MAGELPLKLALKPALGFVILAHGAMAIAAGSEHFVGCAAAFTLVDDQAAG
jgi:hypothetical protein